MTRRLLNAAEDFQAVFRSITTSSFRWECQRAYAVDDGDLVRWRAGQAAVETEDDRQWQRFIRDLVGRGIPFRRVRMVTDPPTEYLRWIAAACEPNVRAGEDIRWIDEDLARDLGAPADDYYLLDNDRIVLLRFDDHRELTGEELIDDPDAVAQHHRWSELLWHHAVQHRDFHLA